MSEATCLRPQRSAPSRTRTRAVRPRVQRSDHWATHALFWIWIFILYLYIYGGGSAGNNAGGSYGDGDSGGDSGEDCGSNSSGAVMIMVEILKDSVHLIPI